MGAAAHKDQRSRRKLRDANGSNHDKLHDDCNVVCQQLRQNDPSVVSVSISGDCSSKVTSIALALPQNTHLRVLQINGSSSKSIQTLAIGLSSSRVEVLNLASNHGIGDEGAEEIARLLLAKNKSCRLKCINLAGCSIGDKGAVSLSTSLQSNTSVKRIFLGANTIGNVGAVALASVLKVNRTITGLYLRCNHIESEGAVALAHALSVNDSLVTLHLDGNPIGIVGLEALADSLQNNHNTTLRNISVNKSDSHFLYRKIQLHVALNRVGSTRLLMMDNVNPALWAYVLSKVGYDKEEGASRVYSVLCEKPNLCDRVVSERGGEKGIVDTS